MVLFTWGDWLNELPVENYIIREGKELQELLEKCGNRYHVLNPHRFGDPVQIKELFQKIIDMLKRNKECFAAEEKQKKFLLLPWQTKERTLTEEEWKKRENELIERVLKALTKDPEEVTVPFVEMAQSMDDGNIPYMGGDVASEYGSISESRNQRALENVAEWFNRFRQSDKSSGIGSTCASSTYRENFYESPQIEVNLPKDIPISEIQKVDHLRFGSSPVNILRRNSL